ncbi:MAG: N-acetyltransferase [Deltaproteobacteria bacterium]|nr:N-acetyltransferase [Deltaproteobacteria bacterium]
MKALLDDFARSGDLLARSRLSLYETIRDFFVLKEGDELVGLSALHICWIDLAEVRSLAVRRDRQGKGYGRVLVERCLDDARRLGLRRVFALTYRPEFFGSLGFQQVDKSELPHKVWQDCVHCAKFPECDETAVMRDLEGETLEGQVSAA